MNDELLQKYQEMEYLFDCSHGRLREIVRELCAELEHYKGQFRYQDQLSPAQLAHSVLDLIQQNQSVGVLCLRLEELFRTQLHKREAAEAVADEAKKLRDSGYDGPMMGEPVEALFTAIRKWEQP